ncbi:MAG: hypothetical protein CMB77_04600 [Euryarchaeota archaeon]|nr:hypothetical protein [Euryarchaeota archaeon]|tara:strand:+ start:5703 stop:6164 length:462 start_codon:yes stop_codon:yes gene_type:complete
MDEDSRIKRLREYVQLYLRRKQKVNGHEKRRIQIFSEEGSVKFRESKTNSSPSRAARKATKNKAVNGRNKSRTKVFSEEIGRNLHTIRQEPYQFDEVFDDVIFDSYPVENGIFAMVKTRDGSKKMSKVFVTPEEADSWMKNKALELSSAFTQS